MAKNKELEDIMNKVKSKGKKKRSSKTPVAITIEEYGGKNG